jgi:hypothetical protein
MRKARVVGCGGRFEPKTRFDHTDDGFGRISPGFSVDLLQQSMAGSCPADQGRQAQGNALSDLADRPGKALRVPGLSG